MLNLLRKWLVAAGLGTLLSLGLALYGSPAQAAVATHNATTSTQLVRQMHTGTAGSATVQGSKVSWSKDSSGRVRATVQSPRVMHPHWPWDDICAASLASAAFAIGGGVLAFVAATGGSIAILGIVLEGASLNALVAAMGTFSAAEAWFADNWC